MRQRDRMVELVTLISSHAAILSTELRTRHDPGAAALECHLVRVLDGVQRLDLKGAAGSDHALQGTKCHFCFWLRAKAGSPYGMPSKLNVANALLKACLSAERAHACGAFVLATSLDGTHTHTLRCCTMAPFNLVRIVSLRCLIQYIPAQPF